MKFSVRLCRCFLAYDRGVYQPVDVSPFKSTKDFASFFGIPVMIENPLLGFANSMDYRAPGLPDRCFIAPGSLGVEFSFGFQPFTLDSLVTRLFGLAFKKREIEVFSLVAFSPSAFRWSVR
ncbi:hypothetical protein [Rhodopirellula bahusiensis]